MIDLVKIRLNDKILTQEVEKKEENIEVLGLKLKQKVDKIFKRSFFIREVDTGSCNACEVEINALSNPYYNLERFGVSFVPSPKFADALMVTGPLTRSMYPALMNAYELTPDPKFVIAVGDCVMDGGDFKDSYACMGGIKDKLPVDLWIKGCPPEPVDLINGLLKLLSKIE
jgi:membrane-bound hydrogenase subunit mbhJ